MFPPQTNNIKFYHEDQIALAAAASSGNKEVLESELKQDQLLCQRTATNDDCLTLFLF